MIPSTFAEDLDKEHYTPWEYVLETATHKCQDVYRKEIANESKEEPVLVLSADTIICLNNGQVIEKPDNEVHHLEILKMLRDAGSHKVWVAHHGHGKRRR